MRELLTALARHALEAYASLRVDERELPLELVTVVPELRGQDGTTIEPSDLMKPGRRTLVIGGAGQGKSVLLQYCAVVASKQFLTNQDSPVPLLVAARMLGPERGGLLSRLAAILTEGLRQPVKEDELIAPSRSGQLALLVDGLDEAGSAVPEIERALTDFGARFPRLGMIVSSRPTYHAAGLNGFETLLLSEFSDAHVREFVERLATSDGGDQAAARSFIDAIHSDGRLRPLSRNPLLLQVLWRVFRARGSVPATRWDLYAEATDFLLSTLRSRPLAVPTSPVRLALWHRVLQRIALWMLARDQHTVDTAGLRSLIEDQLTSDGLAGADPDHIVSGLESAWLLVPTAPATIRFAHRSFEEYFAARALAADPAALATLDDLPNPGGVLAALRDWMPDWRPLLQAAVRAGKWRTAAKIAATGPLNQAEVEFLVDAFEGEFGSAFLNLLRGGNQPTHETPSAQRTGRDVHAELLRLWEDFSAPALDGHEKGRRFETFAEALFGQVFKVVKRDLQTWRGELDLVLELQELSMFWIQFSGDVLVECKNWETRRPVQEVNAFFGKVDQSRVKLAFFVSVSGFTKDAAQALRLRAANPTCALVVPLTGSEVVSMLRARQGFGEFFKARIRAMQQQQKL